MERQDGDAVRVAVIYYSATGNVHGLALAMAEGAEGAGAEVRLRHVEELASELMISQNQHWGRHRSRVADAPVASLDDLAWADGVAFGSPTCRSAVEAVRRSGGSSLAAWRTRRQGRDRFHLVAKPARRTGVDDSRAQQHLLPLGDGDRAARLYRA
jgi:hypothetical protein